MLYFLYDVNCIMCFINLLLLSVSVHIIVKKDLIALILLPKYIGTYIVHLIRFNPFMHDIKIRS